MFPQRVSNNVSSTKKKNGTKGFLPTKILEINSTKKNLEQKLLDKKIIRYKIFFAQKNSPVTRSHKTTFND